MSTYIQNILGQDNRSLIRGKKIVVVARDPGTPEVSSLIGSLEDADAKATVLMDMRGPRADADGHMLRRILAEKPDMLIMYKCGTHLGGKNLDSCIELAQNMLRGKQSTPVLFVTAAEEGNHIDALKSTGAKTFGIGKSVPGIEDEMAGKIINQIAEIFVKAPGHSA